MRQSLESVGGAIHGKDSYPLSDVQPALYKPASAPTSDEMMGKCHAGFPEDSASRPLSYPSSDHMTAGKNRSVLTIYYKAED